MPRKLKVFRTPIGFHDAYVAAPSRKAALEAWGASADLFARGTAEEVTDSRLTAEPLRRPGEVIRVSRGDLQAPLKALGPKKQPRASKAAKPGLDSSSAPEARAAKPEPPPKRDGIDDAEARIQEARQKQARERAALEKQRTAIERKLGALEAQQDEEIARLEAKLATAQARYRAALEKWRS
jgi:hypothetical protein